MKKKFVLTGLSCLFLIFGYSQQKRLLSLVPNKASQAPDYVCTWNIQGYVTNQLSINRTAMTEKNIFDNGIYENWIAMFPKIHKDLYFLLDDSWDVPLSEDRSYFGSLIVDTERFPSVKGMSPEQRLTLLSQRVKGLGWKGLGLWICAQQAPKYQNEDSVYWKERLSWMNKADIKYWKVDWGKKEKSAVWRSSLSELGKRVAPKLIIEHAMTPTVLSSADVYRTYDVENVISIPQTIDRISKLLSYLPNYKAVSIINCEDEPYIAAGLGCSIGIMRHSFTGNLPNGVQDHSIPPVGRDLKNRLDEVVRGVMWHRIALPFSINKTNYYIDSVRLHDYWIMKKDESWIKRNEGYKNSVNAPAIVTRGIEKPQVTLLKGDSIAPYILASKYPNGAVTIASIGRAIGREYITPRANVLLMVERCDRPFGVFGHYNSLTIQVANPIPFTKILAQDLAGLIPIDITSKVTIKGNKIVIPGTVIDEVGLSAATKGDKSEPGMVLIFKK